MGRPPRLHSPLSNVTVQSCAMNQYWRRNREGLGVNILATLTCAMIVCAFWFFHDRIPVGTWRIAYWIGAGVFGLLGFIVFFVPFETKVRSSHPRTETEQSGRPSHWDIIRPPRSRYRTVTKTATSLPFRQSCCFEYGPEGHAHPLRLRGGPTRVIIQFTCRIANPVKAMFDLGEDAMNVLPPKFLEQARGVLETHSAAELRNDREAIAAKVQQSANLFFEEHGYFLESVTIGHVEPLTRGPKQPEHT